LCVIISYSTSFLEPPFKILEAILPDSLNYVDVSPKAARAVFAR
jgi:hypothetical protein